MKDMHVCDVRQELPPVVFLFCLIKQIIYLTFFGVRLVFPFPQLWSLKGFQAPHHPNTQVISLIQQQVSLAKKFLLPRSRGSVKRRAKLYNRCVITIIWCDTENTLFISSPTNCLPLLDLLRLFWFWNSLFLLTAILWVKTAICLQQYVVHAVIVAIKKVQSAPIHGVKT